MTSCTFYKYADRSCLFSFHCHYKRSFRNDNFVIGALFAPRDISQAGLALGEDYRLVKRSNLLARERYVKIFLFAAKIEVDTFGFVSWSAIF